mmetsp:Transcript_2465/g.6583  ORF Transcript_2465/g.6583 Transcript_2465/m.6583 type:complete len:456 (+) Transcript_2465:575-1942(+)|eukprot:CAMPEP_0172359170 /NCGR_PEP_ID=MMETSP1060-20121228/3392_1 /TAXON_ID=37318 /ORGANISM="Pseudo-nitzschia pungens, Strain cf. cingulata" /LENGTH=455 /DNA_ID=CAMNT_0013080705 /DNA_START=580 /DNA_END=1947 /DNA_ORIENTATION=-
MNIAKAFARKALLAFGYPRFETSHPDLAVYEVGAIRVRIAPNLPACQFFYPVDTNSKRDNDDFVPYFREEAVKGLLNYMNGFGDGIMQILEEKAHPLQETYGVDPLILSSGEKLPLVLFSHGLSGNMEMYTELCAQLASTGCVVVATEHEDGSASYSSRVLEDGTVQPILYKPPLPNSKVPYSRQKVLDFRTPMLEQRVDEMRGVYEYFRDENHPAATEADDESVVRKILSVTDPTKLHLVGHSFGGATQLLAAQKWITEGTSQTVPVTTAAVAAVASSADGSGTVSRAATSTMAVDTSSSSPAPFPQSVTVFDAWNFALPDQVLNKGIPVPSNPTEARNSVPVVVSILSEDWHRTSLEVEQTLQFLRNCQPSTTHSYFARDSVHQSVSDTESFLPSVLARKLGNRGPSELRHRTINAMVWEFVKRTKDCGNGNGEINEDDDDDDDEILIKLPLR